jgi:single-strand DNA-binding protein
MINKITLVGHLGQAPEVRRLESGVAVAKFSIATNENYKDKSGEWQKQTEWHDVVVWRELAEYAEKFLKKGMLVYVEGKVTYRKYADQNGVERKLTEVVANTLRILEKRESSATITPNNSEYFPGEPPASVPQRANPTPEPQTQHHAPAATAASSAPSSSSHVAPTPAFAVSQVDDDLPF